MSKSENIDFSECCYMAPYDDLKRCIVCPQFESNECMYADHFKRHLDNEIMSPKTRDFVEMIKRVFQ